MILLAQAWLRSRDEEQGALFNADSVAEAFGEYSRDQEMAILQVPCSALALCIRHSQSRFIFLHYGDQQCCQQPLPNLRNCTYVAPAGVTRSSYTAVPLPAAEVCAVRVMRPGRPSDSMEVVTEQLVPALEWGCVLVEWRCVLEEWGWGGAACLWSGSACLWSVGTCLKNGVHARVIV